jgi:voltage-gated potassium channel
VSEDRRPHTSNIVLPHGAKDPLLAVIRRLLFAVLLIAAVAAIVRIDHEGYKDNNGDGISTLDAFYYATVSVTTTGYGDIVPVTNGARLLSTSIVTVARIIFLVLLVSTTFEVATQHGRDALAQRRWRKRLHDHTIICGFGTTGQSAAKTLLAEGTPAASIVVIDQQRSRIDEATALGLAGIVGDASRMTVLQLSDVSEAKSVIIAPNNDAASVLITLTARELNPAATIVSAVREGQNGHLLRQGGADSVIVSSEASGRLLGMSTYAPRAVDVLEDLLVPGKGLDVETRDVTPEEIGGPPVAPEGRMVMAVCRSGEVLIAADPRAQTVQAGDQLLILQPAPVKAQKHNPSV